MIPDEMWEEALKHLDVFDLLRLRRVSKRFLCMIDKVVKREGKWYEKCLKEVPKKYWTSILEHHTNPELSGCEFYKSKSHSHIWIAMYKSWIEWNNLIDKMTRQTSIEVSGDNSPFITCLSVSSNIIAIGICGAGGLEYVDAYDINELNNGPIYEGDPTNALYNGTIEDMQVQRKYNHLKVITRNSLGVQQWNVVPLLDNPKLHLNGLDGSSLISANLGYFYMLKHTYTSADPCCTLTIEQPPDGDSRIMSWSKSDSLRCVAIGADGDKVILLSIAGRPRNLIIDEIEAKSGELTNLSTIHGIHGSTRCLKIFKPCVVVRKRHESSAISFSVAGRPFKKYSSVLRDLELNSDIKSYYYHIGLLILGLKSGEICIIYVKDADQLENLNLETMKYKILALNDGPVYHVAVTECNSVQYIVAATSRKIHLVEFY